MELSTALQALHFLRPWWLLAGPPLWALAFWLSRRHSKEGNWAGLIDAELLNSLQLEGSGAAQSRSPWPWVALAWSLAVLALAGPSWQHEQSPAFRAPADWVLVLDLSPSMLAADLAPSRTARARYALDDVLAAAHDARVGLVVFSEEAFTVTPLTEDVATIRALLGPLEPGIMPSAGDALAPALERAQGLLAAGSFRKARVLVFSDGFDDPAAAFAAAARLKSKGAELDVVGIGTAGGAPLQSAEGGFAQNPQGQTRLVSLDAGRLQALAAAGGGRYVEPASFNGLLAELKASASPASEAGNAQGIQLLKWRDAGVWLLPFLLLSTALLARRGWL